MGGINRKTRSRSRLLRDYMRAVEGTDKLPPADLEPALMGLYGEVGSVMASTKKYLREGTAYSGHRQVLEEEFGDTLWYLTALCRRLGVNVSDVLSDSKNLRDSSKILAASDRPNNQTSGILLTSQPSLNNQTLLNLGGAAAALLHVRFLDERALDLLHNFTDVYIRSIQSWWLRLFANRSQ